MLKPLKFKTGKKYDVVGVAHALVDVLAYVNQKFLDLHGMDKGTMCLIDEKRAEYLYEYMKHEKLASGGSASNTIAGLASFGAKTALIAKVKDDELGAIFKRDIGMCGVDFKGVTAKEGEATGRCFVAVSREDADRTMCTYLGAAVEMDQSDIDTEVIRDSSVLYYEGYLLDRDGSREAMMRAAEIAHESGHIVSMSLSDARCVAQHRYILSKMLEDIDVVFANEEEVKTLFQVDNFDDAVQRMAQKCNISVITRGKDGSVVAYKDHRIHVPAAADPKNIVDTTGAGDLYASGFLFGMIQGRNLDECAYLGSLAAAEVISHIGARPEITLSILLDRL